jgi:hypothetical protein
MRTGISITISASDRRRLESLVGIETPPQKHVWRTQIILFSADAIGASDIMRRMDKSRTCVRRWRERFMEEGFDGPPSRHDAGAKLQIPTNSLSAYCELY